MSMKLVERLFSFYKFDDHINTEEKRQMFIDTYAMELCKRNIPDPDAVMSHLMNNYKYKTIPTIEWIGKAISQCESSEDQKSRKDKLAKDYQDKYMEFYQRRRENRKSIYHANTDRIENIIARGWGMDLACELSYCAENADRHGRMDSLIRSIKARAHYSSPRTKGQDPLYYFENMPINHRNLTLNLKHPVDFIKDVRS